jgi:uncharacterized membrane protein
MSSSPKHPAERLEYIDALRGLAIVMMIAVHGLRGLMGRPWRDRLPGPDMQGLEAFGVHVWWWVYTTTPFISTLFLTLVGFSLTLSIRRAADPGRWRRRQSVRALGLVGISMTFFLVERGVHWPYPFLSAGILHTIGVGILIGVWVVGEERWRRWALVAWVLATCAVTALAEAQPDHPLARLAQGPGSHAPNLVFVALGAALGRWAGEVPVRLRRVVPALGVLVLVVYHVGVLPPVQEAQAAAGRERTVLETAFNQPWGRITMWREWDVGPGLGSLHQLKQLRARVRGDQSPPPEGLRRHPFWNKRLRQVPWLAGVMLLLFGLAWTRPAAELLRRAAIPLRPLLIPGRYALRVYVFHLVVLAVVVTAAGRAKHPPVTSLAITAGVFLLSWGFAELSERRRRSRRQSSK